MSFAAAIGILVTLSSAVAVWRLQRGRRTAETRARIHWAATEGADEAEWSRARDNLGALEAARALFASLPARSHRRHARRVVADDELPVDIRVSRARQLLVPVVLLAVGAFFLSMGMHPPLETVLRFNFIPVPALVFQALLVAGVAYVFRRDFFGHWLEAWSVRVTFGPAHIRYESRLRRFSVPYSRLHVFLSGINRDLFVEVGGGRGPDFEALRWAIEQLPQKRIVPLLVTKALEYDQLEMLGAAKISG